MDVFRGQTLFRQRLHMFLHSLVGNPWCAREGQMRRRGWQCTAQLLFDQLACAAIQSEPSHFPYRPCLTGKACVTADAVDCRCETPQRERPVVRPCGRSEERREGKEGCSKGRIW